MPKQSEPKELKFQNVKLPKDNFLGDLFLLLLLLIVLPLLLLVILNVNLAVAITSFVLLLFWKLINSLIYYFFYGNISVKQAYFNNIDDYYETSISLKKEVLDDLYINKNTYGNEKKYYLGKVKKPNDRNSLIELLSFNYNFENAGKTNLFFIVSLFVMNSLYSVMILSSINIAIEYFREWSLYKESLLFGLVIVFGVTIIKLVKDSSPSSAYLQDILKDKDLLERLKETEILEVVNRNKVEELKIEKIEKLYVIRTRSIEKIKSSIFQIMTPIFFLSYISIIISYTK